MVGSVAHCAALWGWPFVNKSKPANLDTLVMHCAVHENLPKREGCGKACDAKHSPFTPVLPQTRPLHYWV